MKRQMLSICGAVFFLFVGVTLAGATLIDLNNGITQDDRGTLTAQDDTYWIQDLNMFNGLTYDEQIIAISNLNVAGLTNVTWRMATYSDLLSLEALYPMWTTSSEIADAFVPTGSSGGFPHWSGRYDRIFNSSNPNDPNAPYHYEVNIWINPDLIYGWGLNVGIGDSLTSVGAFVVGSVEMAPVPEPATFFLLATGIIGLIGTRIRRNKKA